MSMVFQFRPGCHLKGDAQVVGSELTKIRENLGRLTAPDVVDAARDQSSPLHQYFEWDDKEAANQHRLAQARHLVRSVVITETEEHGEIRPIRAFCKVATQEVNSYEPIARVLSDKSLREAVLREVRSEIKSLRDKVQTYEELTDVLGALDAVDAVTAQHLQEAALG